MPYSCSFAGTCEWDDYGQYPDLASCEAACVGQANPDTTRLIYQYAPAEAAQVLAPSDRVRLVRQLIGVDVSAAASYDALLAIDHRDPFLLARHPELHDYLAANYDEDTTAEALVSVATPAALSYMQEHDLRYYGQREGLIGQVILRSQGDSVILQQLSTVIIHQRVLAMEFTRVVKQLGLRVFQVMDALQLELDDVADEMYYDDDQDPMIFDVGDAIIENFDVEIYRELLHRQAFEHFNRGVELATRAADTAGLEFCRWLLRHTELLDTRLRTALRFHNYNYARAFVELISDDRPRLATLAATLPEETQALFTQVMSDLGL